MSSPAPPNRTPYAGAGSGGNSGPYSSPEPDGKGGDAMQNTGAGGGGGGHDSARRTAGNGGSGLVLIAYPS